MLIHGIERARCLDAGKDGKFGAFEVVIFATPGALARRAKLCQGCLNDSDDALFIFARCFICPPGIESARRAALVIVRQPKRAAEREASPYI
ncbi:MAG: hypothetical protein KatS3mg052_1544 [Candidatus Roseilinea sp.]|nr:MAG: hypothetical protein KatS3mg052_1544 [Candidatus Roseilinea sp.]